MTKKIVNLEDALDDKKRFLTDIDIFCDNANYKIFTSSIYESEICLDNLNILINRFFHGYNREDKIIQQAEIIMKEFHQRCLENK